MTDENYEKDALNGKILDRRFVPKDTLVIEEGQPASCAYYMEKGAAEVYTTDIDGRKISLAPIGPEDIFGEMALITRGIRTANVCTTENSTIVKITPEDFRRSYSGSNKVFKKLMVALVDRLIDANHHIAAQHKTIADLEDAAHLTVMNVSKSIPEELRDKFVMEVKPVLDHLQTLLSKYKKLIPVDELEELEEKVVETGKKLSGE